MADSVVSDSGAARQSYYLSLKLMEEVGTEGNNVQPGTCRFIRSTEYWGQGAIVHHIFAYPKKSQRKVHKCVILQ